MTDLSNGTNCEIFVRRLETCEKSINSLNEREQEFIRDMRSRFDSREDAIDMGYPLWNPSVGQWNYLVAMWELVR